MKFRNKKRTEWWICKLVEGQWEFWGHTFKTELAAIKDLKENYNDEDHFCVVEITMTSIYRGTKKRRGGL